MDESADFEQAQLSAESADFANQDPVEKTVQEDKKVDTNDVAANSGISTRPALVCSQKKSFWINAFSLKKPELDMVILA